MGYLPPFSYGEAQPQLLSQGVSPLVPDLPPRITDSSPPATQQSMVFESLEKSLENLVIPPLDMLMANNPENKEVSTKNAKEELKDPAQGSGYDKTKNK